MLFRSTDELERRILAMVREIESMGTLKEVSESGWFRQLFQNAMTRRAKAIQAVLLATMNKRNRDRLQTRRAPKLTTTPSRCRNQ